MNTAIFKPILTIIGTRRPNWTFVIEDNTLRIHTMQFVLQWDIIDEILQNEDYKCTEIIMHQAMGQVVCITYVGGT